MLRSTIKLPPTCSKLLLTWTEDSKFVKAKMMAQSSHVNSAAKNPSLSMRNSATVSPLLFFTKDDSDHIHIPLVSLSLPGKFISL